MKDMHRKQMPQPADPESPRHFTFHIQTSKEKYCRMLTRSHFRQEDLGECLIVWKDLYGEDSVKAMSEVQVWYRREKAATDSQKAEEWLEKEEQKEKQNKITVVMTLGPLYDRRIVEYESRGELLKAYTLECYAMELLWEAYMLFQEEIYKREHQYPGEFYFFDVEQMKKVPEMLVQMGIEEVCCNEALALIPQKTVVFMTEMSDEKRSSCGSICESCDRYSTCPNRQSGSDGEKETKTTGVLNYGYQRILGNKENDLWKED